MPIFATRKKQSLTGSAFVYPGGPKKTPEGVGFQRFHP